MNLFLRVKGKRKTVINASELHIHIGLHYPINNYRLLPNCGETYEYVFGDIAAAAVRNMKNCTTANEEFDFHHYFNIDRGSLANVEHIRNCMLYYMKDKLGIDQTSTQWINECGIVFDFTQYFVIVGQELYHLVIRCRNKRIWNYHHSDCWFVIRAFQSVAKQYQLKYDIRTTPDVITEFKSTPYKVYELCPLLNVSRNFVAVQRVVISYLQLNGTNLKYNANEYHQLNQILLSDQLYDEDNGLLAKGVVAAMLAWCYDHLTPRSIARFESVKFLTKLKMTR